MINNHVIEEIKKSKQNKVRFAVTDIDGVLRGKTIHLQKFLEIIESGVGFCDVVFGWDVNDKCYENSRVTGWHTAYPDAIAKIDLNTYRCIPWNNQLPFFLADFDVDKGMGVCPRTLLKKIRSEAEYLGLKAIFSQEFEWYNFEKESIIASVEHPKPITSGMFGYSMLKTANKQDYFNAIFEQLAEFKIDIEGLHTETGPGVYEAAIRYDEILASADKAVLFKNSIKEIAMQYQVVASFMAKWNEKLPGCSGHIHQSIWSIEENKNLLFSEGMELSATMSAYLAGVLHCLPYLMPMYAPTVNSYKRLQQGTWAPTTVSWGFENRTTAVRVIKGSEKSTRIEVRVPGSDVNPYLAFAATLASGLYGIKNNLKLEIAPTVGNAYENATLEHLPSNLLDAILKMKNSTIATELFGATFVDHFIKTREWEWSEFERSVTNWEMNRYFEII